MELILLGVHLVMNEYQKMTRFIKQVESARIYTNCENNSLDTMLEKPINEDDISSERFEIYISGLRSLTPKEKSIYDAYVARVTSKEIMANMNIKETTLKYHNRNIYGKLGVSSRKELLELHTHLKSMSSKFTEYGSL